MNVRVSYHALVRSVRLCPGSTDQIQGFDITRLTKLSSPCMAASTDVNNVNFCLPLYQATLCHCVT